MTLEGMKLTKHVLNERMGRIEYIRNTVGFGETVRVVKQENRVGLKCITDTGVIVIRDEMDMRVMVTCYVASLAQARSCFPNGVLPRWLFAVVQENVKAGHVEMCNLLDINKDLT